MLTYINTIHNVSFWSLYKYREYGYGQKMVHLINHLITYHSYLRRCFSTDSYPWDLNTVPSIRSEYGWPETLKCTQWIGKVQGQRTSYPYYYQNLPDFLPCNPLSNLVTFYMSLTCYSKSIIIKIMITVHRLEVSVQEKIGIINGFDSWKKLPKKKKKLS